MSAFLIAVVMIFAIMAATIAFTVKVLSSTPARIAVVMTAMTGMIVGFPAIINALEPQTPPTPPPADVRPAQPGTAGVVGQ
ncbi:hypothetical protein ACH492_29270 [Streptomyces sp. NPDC019443]|uniref:hypothetical protein n=1 Tax=Streptomyces sp. NPDC019443 TaxID=3365061 RepID=UPI0037AAE251